MDKYQIIYARFAI